MSRLSGGRGRDILIGGSGDDRLYANPGNDRLNGESGNDTMQGGQGQDILFGSEGNDILEGSEGIDTAIGGPGQDAFILQTNASFDRIIDFENGVDRLGLPNGLEFSDFTITQSNSNTFIANNSLIAVLTNVEASTITANDFAPVLRVV